VTAARAAHEEMTPTVGAPGEGGHRLVVRARVARAHGAVEPRLVVVFVATPLAVSETFVEREVSALRRRGMEVRVEGCARAKGAVQPADGDSSRMSEHGGPTAAWILPFRALVALLHHPRRTVRVLRRASVSVPWNARGASLAVAGLAVTFGVAPTLERAAVGCLHAHFVHLPALVASLVAEWLRVPFSISAHARDIFVPEVDLSRLCRDARFVAVCSECGQRALAAQLPESTRAKIVLCRHGLDLSAYAYRPPRSLPAGAEVKIVSICRLVPKKGVDAVLRALVVARRSGLRFSYEVVGDGPLRHDLTCLAEASGLREVSFTGPVPPAESLQKLSQADLLVLGCRVASDGDRDGVPNVVLEAMACGVPVLASDAGGVAEVIRADDTGLLVPPDDAESMAAAMLRLFEVPDLRRSLAERARRMVEEQFALDRTVAPLVDLLRQGWWSSCDG